MDYYTHYSQLNPDKLSDEIRRLRDIVFRANPNSPIQHQLADMLDMAERIQMERDQRSMISGGPTGQIPKDDIIELGTIEEHVHTPDYSSSDYLTITATLYLDKPSS